MRASSWASRATRSLLVSIIGGRRVAAIIAERDARHPSFHPMTVIAAERMPRAVVIVGFREVVRWAMQQARHPRHHQFAHVSGPGLFVRLGQVSINRIA